MNTGNNKRSPEPYRSPEETPVGRARSRSVLFTALFALLGAAVIVVLASESLMRFGGGRQPFDPATPAQIEAQPEAPGSVEPQKNLAVDGEVID